MPSLTIKSIPEDLLNRLRQSAAAHRRSLNSEVLVRLESSVGSTRLDPDAFLARIDALRESVNMKPISDEFLEQAKREGRP
ncbi:MAG TPA: Arc family DNA-binding protein [Longimicrobium sp.]|jgi:plasmid stability protein